MELNLQNKALLEELEYFRNKFYELLDPSDMNLIMNSKKEEPTPEEVRYQCSTERLNHLIETENDRPFPLDYYALPLGHLKESGKKLREWTDLHRRIRYELPVSLGVSSSTLINWYPKNGLTGWHTNSNSSGYQFLLTWSENGEGVFKFKDAKTQEIHSIQDKPGWQARWYVFGDKPENYCWHCCYTDCHRITVALKIDNIDQKITEDFRDEFISEIETS